MDLTPKVINEAEFSMARRGYDPDQVDEFLEKVAVAVGELQDRLGELRDRVAIAERRAAEAERRAAEPAERVVGAPSPEAVAGVSAAAEAELETLKRTLLLAQRTADAAVREAEEEARRMITEAEAEARSAHETTRRRVVEEIASLETTRDVLRDDVETLDRQADAQRTRLQSTIDDLQRLLDDPSRLPDESTAYDEAPSPSALQPDEEPSMLAAEPEPPRTPEQTRAQEPPAGPTASASPFVVADERGDDDAWARFGPADDEYDAGPRTEPVLRLDRLEAGNGAGADDAYLAELRKAMLDDTGAPDASEIGFFDEPDHSRAARSSRFGRRR